MAAELIMVIDDEPAIRAAFEQFIVNEGFRPLVAADGEQAEALLTVHDPLVIFLDYRLPCRDGLQLLPRLRMLAPGAAIVFMTAYGDMEVAIKAMQNGAYDYLTKPLDLGKLRQLLRKVVRVRQGERAYQANPEGEIPRIRTSGMIGQSPAMQEIYKMIGLLAMRDVTVLITGESGAGKELVARGIHQHSSRRSAPFVAVNCGAMPETLLEAEMFGYEKGAFTGAAARKAGKFEAAGNGTLFLDEIGELPLPLQVKLLRVLQERTFERVGGNCTVSSAARIITASNRDLQREVEAGRFRTDLYYRINISHIHLPPLRDRREDIPLLADHLIARANKDFAAQVSGLTPDALDWLCTRDWPGNVRELENQIRRAVVTSRDTLLTRDSFASITGSPAEQETRSAFNRVGELARSVASGIWQAGGNTANEGVLQEAVAAVEAALVDEALKQTDGNQLQAANILGIHRSTLRTKMEQFTRCRQ